MNKTEGNFFEAHIEKLILAVVGVLCIWLLASRVLISPNKLSYDGKKFSPGEIDAYISRQAESLQDKLDGPAEPTPVYKSRLDDFTGLVQSPASNIDVVASWPLPDHRSGTVFHPKYDVPQIGKVSEVAVEHIRAVAYVPTEEIGVFNPYSEDNSEPNDIDLVTVDAKFDVAKLCESFYENFAGTGVKEQWRDPCCARPVFAAVQLQRQQLDADSSWSDWVDVPRAKIEAQKETFKIIEDVEKLPAGGIKVRVLQFDDSLLQADMLQPESYRIASAEQEWFPPCLYGKYLKCREDIKSQELREAREKAAEEKERKREDARKEREKARSARSGNDTAKKPRSSRGSADKAALLEMLGGPKKKTRKVRSPRKNYGADKVKKRAIANEPETIDDIYDEFDEILIDDKTDFAEMSEPLLFWAYDDTVEPGKSYRYRIRLGIFNPVAGTDQFSETGMQFKDKVILWSDFSGETAIVDVPERLYFFAYDIQEVSKAAMVQVYRYLLGYWHSKDFTVRQGEVVGGIVTSEKIESEEEQEVLVPERIDYTTGAVLVDFKIVNDWAGSKFLKQRRYYSMLYSYDGTNIEQLAVKQQFWPLGLRSKYNELRNAQQEKKKPLRDWGSRTAGRKRRDRPIRKPGKKDSRELLEMLLGM